MLQSQHHVQVPCKWPQADGAVGPNPACAGEGQHAGRCAPRPAGLGPSYAPQEPGMGPGGAAGGEAAPQRPLAVAWHVPTTQLSCRLCPTAPGLHLLPDLESSRWESCPGSHSRGWQHAAQGDHRGGGHLTPYPSTPGTSSHQPPFPLKSPWLTAVPGDRGGTQPPQHGSCILGWQCRGVPGKQPWPHRTDSRQRRSRRCLH